MTKQQSDKFKEAAKEHEADLDEARWEERLKKVAKPIPIALSKDELETGEPKKPRRR